MAHQTCLIGFPPADHAVHDFLTLTPSGGIDNIVFIMRHFLIALFKQAMDTIKKMGPISASDQILDFRTCMSKAQTMLGPGEDRNQFYDHVVTEARTVCPKYFIHSILSNSLGLTRGQLKGAKEEEVRQALMELRNAFNTKTPCIYDVASKGTYVDIFLAFDEAHTIADPLPDEKESRFVVLRRVLNSLSSEPLFSFFLSTTSKITQFGKPRGHDPSNRINSGTLATPRPYIYLGFDQLMQSRKVGSRWRTLEHITSLDCIAHMGRPL
jgi:hypothetical protein